MTVVINSIIVVEQVFGTSELSTYNLKLRYKNHKADFDAFAIPQSKLEEMFYHGVASVKSCNKSGMPTILTIINPVYIGEDTNYPLDETA